MPFKNRKSILKKHEAVEFSDPNDAASLLKAYLRELTPPLVPYNLYDSIIEIEENVRDPEQKLAKYKLLESSLPQENRDTLMYITQFLHELADNAAETKMDIPNLSVVFAPNLLRPQVDTEKSLLSDTAKQIDFTKFIVQNYKKLFQVPAVLNDWLPK